jgi:uncharacterized protein (TIGR02246 family)
MIERKTAAKMPSEEIANVVRKLNEALSKGDIETLMSFYAEDATLLSPNGKFQGKDAIRHNWTWSLETWRNLTTTETEFGVMAMGSKVAAEHTVEGTVGGMKVSIPIPCLYEFSGDKIQLHKMTYDRLSLAKQAAKGWLSKRLVGSIEAQMEKGLH